MNSNPAPSKGRRFGRRLFSSSKEETPAVKQKAQPVIANGNSKVAEKIQELEREKSPPPNHNESVNVVNRSNIGLDWEKNPSMSASGAQTTVTTRITAETSTPKIQKRQSKVSSLFDLFTKPKVERARGYSEGRKLESIQMMPPPPMLMPTPAPNQLRAQEFQGTVPADSQVYINGHPVGVPKPPMSNVPNHSPNLHHQNQQFQPQYTPPQNYQPQQPQLLNQGPISQRQQYQPASVRQRFQQYQPPRQEDIWDPPPLFQAYPQAEKYGKLLGTNASNDSLIRSQQIRKANRTGSSARDQQASSDAPGRGRLKRLSVMTGSYADSHPDVVDKIFVLVTAGRLVQYCGSGSSDRMPEKILRLGANSAAFVCDLIPGRHWVLQVVQNSNDIGPGGVLTSDSADTLYTSNSSTVKPSRSILSRLRMTSTRGRNVSSLLLIFQSPEEMAAWLKAFRGLIERLGGRRRDKEDPEVKREKEREREETVRKRFSQQPSHRFLVQREPGQFGETPATTNNKREGIQLLTQGDFNSGIQKVSPISDRKVSVISASSGAISPLMGSTPPIPEGSEETENSNEEPVPSLSSGYFNGVMANVPIKINTNVTSDVKGQIISSTGTSTTTSPSQATGSSLSPDMLRLEPLKETSRFSSASVRTSRTSEGETTGTAATSPCSSLSSAPSPKKKELSPTKSNIEATDSPSMPLPPGQAISLKADLNDQASQRPQSVAITAAQPRQQTLSLAARRSKAPQPFNLSANDAPAVPTLPANAIAASIPGANRLSIAVLPTNGPSNQDGQLTPRFARAMLVDVPKSPRSPRLPPLMMVIGEDSKIGVTDSINERISPKKRPMSTMAPPGMPRGDFGGAGNRRSYFRPVPIPVRPSVAAMPPLPTRNQDVELHKQEKDVNPSAMTIDTAKPLVLSTPAQFKAQLADSRNSRQNVNDSRSSSTQESAAGKEKENVSEMSVIDVATRLQQIDADITRRLSRIKEQQAQDSAFGFDTLIGRQSATRATSRASVAPMTAAIPESPSMPMSMDLPSRPPSRTIHHSRESLVVAPSHMNLVSGPSIRRNSSLSSTTGTISLSRSSSPATVTRTGAGSRLSTSSSLSLTQTSTSSTSPSSTTTATATQPPGKLRRPASVQIRADPAPFLSSRRSSSVNHANAGPKVVGSRMSMNLPTNRTQNPMVSALQASLVAESIIFEEKNAHGRALSRDLATLAALSGGATSVNKNTNTDSSTATVTATATMKPLTLRSSSSPIPVTVRAVSPPLSANASNSAKQIVDVIASDLESIRQHQHKLSTTASRSVTPTIGQHGVKSSASSIDLSGNCSRRSSVLLASNRPLSPPPTISPPPAPSVARSRPSLSLTQSEITLSSLDAAFSGPAPSNIPPAVPKRNPARPIMVGRSASVASVMGGNLRNGISSRNVAASAGPPPTQLPLSKPGGIQALPPRMPPPDCPLPRLPAELIGQ